MQVDHRLIADSDGDTNFGAVAGFGNDRTHILASFGLQRRSRISNRDRGVAFRPYFENPQGGRPVNDPPCAALGDVPVTPSSCLYTYTPLDDLI